MIYYFSATGNNQYVARQVAEHIGDEIKSISECMDEKDYSLCTSDRRHIGFVVPTYAWGLPDIVKRFFSKVSLHNKKAYIFFIATYGTTPGFIDNAAKKILKKTVSTLTLIMMYRCLIPGLQLLTFLI